MTFGSLFAGIGGIDLGFEKAGMECRWQVEIDPFCQAVLAKHWPNVKRHEDIKTIDFQSLERVDVIAGGFPCQDVSVAGERKGFEGERSPLWFQMWECVCVLQPRFVVVENVAGLLSLGMGRVLGDLARIGYDCEWESLSASSFGGEHRRKRVFVVAYPHSARSQVWGDSGTDGYNEGIFGSWPGFAKRTPAAGLERRGASRWCRDVHGIPGRVDRIRALGNAVVPQIAEWIGRRIVKAEELAEHRTFAPAIKSAYPKLGNEPFNADPEDLSEAWKGLKR
jgi:DNA (cytosine-5)-methyltransferase 1